MFAVEKEEKRYVKREYKDTVFRMLFGKKKNLLELYNGLNGTDYQNEEELEIYTLENAVYMGMKNDVSFLLLSDSFEKETDDPKLELKVLQLNINDGKNKELMERCRTLREYSQYVACVRKYKETETLEDAVDHAVTECIRKGILREFLQEQRAEVVAMSIFEYDEEEEKRKLREAEFAYGREEGIKQGIEQERKEILVLMQRLFAAGRAGEAERAVADEAYRKRLLEEFGLGGKSPQETEG